MKYLDNDMYAVIREKTDLSRSLTSPEDMKAYVRLAPGDAL